MKIASLTVKQTELLRRAVSQAISVTSGVGTNQAGIQMGDLLEANELAFLLKQADAVLIYS